MRMKFWIKEEFEILSKLVYESREILTSITGMVCPRGTLVTGNAVLTRSNRQKARYTVRRHCGPDGFVLKKIFLAHLSRKLK